jgi:hypothetical protein
LHDIYAFTIKCAVEEGFPVPEKVMLSLKKCQPPVVSLNVIDARKDTMKYNFTVCLHEPLFGVTEEVLPRLMEWIAVNRVFGADHFVMYTVNATDFFRHLLQPIVDTRLLEFYQWELDYPRSMTSDSHGQISVIQDCIYRHMYNSRSVVLLDFDEFPTPHRHETWNELLTSVSATNSSCLAVASFRNAFFPFNQTQQPHPSGFDLKSLTLTKRQPSLMCNRRSKLIVDPRVIRQCTVHIVRHTLSSKHEQCCLPVELALLHHYRSWPSHEEIEITDSRMWHFAKKIVKSAREIFKVMQLEIPKFSNGTS